MPTMPPIPTMPTTFHESEYYSFYVKETADSRSGNNITFSRLPNLDLKLLRTKLRKLFGVPESRRIFYIDDDGDNVPIDSECEFHEALKLARNSFEVNNAIPLIVGSFNESDGEQSSCMHENRCSDKEQLKNVDVNSTWKANSWINRRSFIYSDPRIRKPYSIQGPGTLSKETINFSKRRMDLEYDEQRHTNCKMSPNKKKLDAKQFNGSNKIEIRLDGQTQSKNVGIQGEWNASLQHCSDALPPLWFIKYMESMKKDMVSTITNEVVENVTKALTERLDSLVFSYKNQSGSQYSSLAAQYPQCSDSNEENQKKIRSQDKEQLSDASIERADESRNENTMKNIQMKKDVISTITNEVVKEVTELLNKIPADPLTSVPCKDPFQNQFLSHFPSSTGLSQNSFDSYLNEKNQKTMKLQDREQSNDNISTVRVDEASWYSKILDNSTRLLQRRLDLIEDAIRANAEKEKKKRQDQQIAQTIELTGDIGREKEQSVQNNAREDLISRKSLPLQMDSKVSNDIVYLDVFKLVENEFRMNCSVTGHQMLNEGFLSKDTLVCDTFDNKLLKTEKDVQEILSNNLTSSWSCNQEQKEEKEQEEDDDTFEIIHIPAFNEDLSIIIEQRHHDSNRDSPSFELLSEPPSPPCSIHLNEDHFSANEEKLEQQSMETNPTNSVYVMDVHGKIFNDEHQMNPDECVSVDLKKQPNVTYFFAKDEDLLMEDEDEACSSKSPCAEHWSNEPKSPQDDVNGSYDDVRNSHASYLTVQTHCDSKTQSQCNCESQTDLDDLTQSFHSHTTSVTGDIADIYVHTYANGMHDEPVISTTKDVREVTTTATAPPKNNHDVRMDGGWTKEIRTNQNHRYKCLNNYPEYSCTLNNNCSCLQDPSFGASGQSYHPNRSSDRSCSNIGSRKALSSAREHALMRAASVHMLPETLVSAATQVGSFAFDTAREMFDKLRAHTKEDPLKRHSEVKCENKKSFPVGHLPF